MLQKNQLKEKLNQLKNQSEILDLSKHKAQGEWIIVAPAEIEEPGITTRKAQFEDRPEVGIIVSVGDEVTSISEGDVVFFAKYSHVQVSHDEINYLIMRQEDVYCVA